MLQHPKFKLSAQNENASNKNPKKWNNQLNTEGGPKPKTNDNNISKEEIGNLQAFYINSYDADGAVSNNKIWLTSESKNCRAHYIYTSFRELERQSLMFWRYK